MNIDSLICNYNKPLLDVRSEDEFAQGHIPGALNKPLLNNEERKLVGTCYKQKGHDAAVELGYKLVGHKFDEKLQDVKNSVAAKELMIYCWRGGMRSKVFCELLENGGFKTQRLDNGYKAFRQWAIKQLSLAYPFIILGGATGTGKTQILQQLKQKGEQVIDLEAMANHKGSSYGGIGMEPQPTNEQFENNLAFELNTFNLTQPIWIENESRHLGKIKLPDPIYDQMRLAKVIEITIPRTKRIDRIAKEYSGLPKEELIKATTRLEKRLGNLIMKTAIEHIQKNEFREWIDIMLTYYDKLYNYSNSQRNREAIFKIELNEMGDLKNTETILEIYGKYFDKKHSSKLNAI